MPGEVICPSCGKPVDAELAKKYRVCTHCGNDLSTPVEAPIQETAMPTAAPWPGPGVPPGQQPPVQQFGQLDGQQPYGQQPYGQQPYPMPYQQPYGTPMYGAYPPTNHPGVYEKPEETPRFDIGNLLRVRFSPQRAFENLYNHSSAKHGIILAIVFAILSAGISAVLMTSLVGSIDLPEEANTAFVGETEISVVSLAVSVVLSLVFFLLSAYLIHAFLKGKGVRPSLEKTIALTGYAKLPGLIISIVIAFLIPMMLGGLPSEFFDDDPTNDEDAAAEAIGNICGITVLIVVVLIVGLIWALWVHGHAAAVANDTNFGTAIGYVFLAWFLVFLIAFAISLVLSAIGLVYSFV